MDTEYCPAAKEMMMSKPEFLLNVREARNLFVHQRETADSARVNTADCSRALSRAAIWLTPKSVANFNAADFPELGEKQSDLQTAVQTFRTIAKEVPPNEPAIDTQLGNAKVAFERILKIVEPYLPTHEEGKHVETALKEVQYPDWVVTWDYELGSDEDETPAVWLNVYADEETGAERKAGVGSLSIDSRFKEATHRGTHQ